MTEKEKGIFEVLPYDYQRVIGIKFFNYQSNENCEIRLQTKDLSERPPLQVWSLDRDKPISDLFRFENKKFYFRYMVGNEQRAGTVVYPGEFDPVLKGWFNEDIILYGATSIRTRLQAYL